MLKRVALSGCAAALVIAAAPAGAADIDNIIYAPDLPETRPVEIGNGWYLRGDLGYSLSTRGAAESFSIFSAGPPASYTTEAYDSSQLDSDWSGSLGVGYQFTDFLRADVAFDYSTGRFDGAEGSAAPCAGAPAGTACSTADSADFDSYGIMANAYADLGTFAGLTPYVGGGLGMTQVRWGDLTSTSTCVAGAAACPVPAAASTIHPGEDDWRFTYQLMAGVSYDLTENLKVDVGYRYQKVDGGPMYGFDAASATAGATGAQASDDGIAKHELRAGLRYSLW